MLQGTNDLVRPFLSFFFSCLHNLFSVLLKFNLYLKKKPKRKKKTNDFFLRCSLCERGNLLTIIDLRDF